MKDREVRLYNAIFPVWLLWLLFPWMWLVILPGNLLIDALAVLFALWALKRQDKGRLMTPLAAGVAAGLCRRRHRRGMAAPGLGAV